VGNFSLDQANRGAFATLKDKTAIDFFGFWLLSKLSKLGKNDYYMLLYFIFFSMKT